MTESRRLAPGLLVVLSFLAAVGPLATDMYLASFTDIAAELQAPPSSVQLTLTAFLVGMGAGQLLLGPLSDQLGRRPVLVAALAVFAAASIALVWSPNIGVFIALRLVQGLSGAAGVVVSRAIAVDLATGDAAIRAISLIAMFTGLGPLLAPPLGGAILVLGDWRAVLGALAILATAMFLLALLRVPESLPRAQRSAAGIATALRSIRALLGDAGFVTLSCAFALAFGAMLAYIAASPFVGQVVLGMPPLVYALGFAAGALALVAGNFANARLAGRVRPTRMLALGAALLLVAGLAATALTTTRALAPPSFIACAFVLSAGASLMMANASALALARSGSHRGSGSALLGAGQFAVGGVASPLVGAWGEHTALPMALVILAAALLSATAVAVSLRRG
ncbi:multidrug effflux MFS transporter [Leucobacter allii]|uniref:multidrug effflux MFS transporter n=1 Tax=Leucobacter allii TaxID=2932247 RepID=UPI001FD05928|nr:multidrug effflux MFS transporter [Leucobacter allii]UOR00664.1 multidrug effflux MFS transporter [Leucobacter allii]